MLVFGTRLFGGTDEVPGLFSVSTKFAHIDFLPLCPLGSYLVLKRQFGSYSGIEIPLSGKSVALGYIRALATIATLGTLVWAFIVQGDERVDEEFWIVLGYFACCLVLACLLMFHSSTRRASYERASELAGILAGRLGPRAGPTIQRLVDQHFGRVAFAVVATHDDEDDGGIVEALAEIEGDLELNEDANEDKVSAQAEKITSAMNVV